MWPRREHKTGGNWTAVIFSPGRVDLAEVARVTDEKPVLRRWESFGAEGGEAETLKRLRKKLSGGRCTTLLRHGQYQMLQVEAPAMPEGSPAAERCEALRWRVKEMVDFPVDQAGVDLLDIPAPKAGGRNPQVFAVLASHAVLTPRIRAFQEAKLPLACIDIPELAQRNVAALFEEPNRGLALLSFDDDGGRLTFTYQGELFASRHIEVTRKEIAEATGDAAGGLFERVLLDVQRSLDNFDRNYNFITLTRLLVAPIAGAEAFVEYLKANLYQPVELLDLARSIDLGQVPGLAEPARQAEALLAIGAALRQEAA